jgi:hypothetical protein
MIFVVYQVQKGHYMSPIYTYHLFLCIIILLGGVLICLIYVMNDFHRLWYIHADRQVEIQPKKPCNSKTSPMTPDLSK